MRILIAIDSFKGSLSSVEAGNSAKEGIKRVYPEADVIVRSIADGGEGTVDALVDGMHGTKVKVNVTGPLGDKISAEYGIVSGEIAVMEMSSAAGITLIPESKRNPMKTTTFGVGEMIADAVNRGCRKFVVGIGGSVTNDGGAGMLSALGFDFLDINNKPIPLGAIGLKDLHSIDNKRVRKELYECEFNIACDVTNPLCGDNGCSKIFAPQKGADENMILKMDEYLMKYSEVSKKINPDANKDASGSGAAGGLGFAFMTFLNGKLQNGIELILKEIGLEENIKDCDFVVTGEGRLDSQTVMGKAPIGIAAIAKKYGIPVIAFSGCVGDGVQICNKHGIDAFFPILRRITSASEAMNTANAKSNLADTAEQVFRAINLNFSNF